MGCLAGSREHTWIAHLGSLAAAALLAAPVPILLAAPADAAGETSAKSGHPEAMRTGGVLTIRIGDLLVSFDGLRTGSSRSREAGKREGTPHVDRRRWRDWTWSSFVRSGAYRYTDPWKWGAFAVRTTTGEVARTGAAGPASGGSGHAWRLREDSRGFHDGPSPVLALSFRAGAHLDDDDAGPATRPEPEYVSGLDTN